MIYYKNSLQPQQQSLKMEIQAQKARVGSHLKCITFFIKSSYLYEIHYSFDEIL